MKLNKEYGESYDGIAFVRVLDIGIVHQAKFEHKALERASR